MRGCGDSALALDSKLRHHPCFLFFFHQNDETLILQKPNQTVQHSTYKMEDPNPTDDSFQLYDLKVQVVCPPGERILCGAKDGDYFTLQGEMLHLPPGQGISIYSLCEDIS